MEISYKTVLGIILVGILTFTATVWYQTKPHHPPAEEEHFCEVDDGYYEPASISHAIHVTTEEHMQYFHEFQELREEIDLTKPEDLPLTNRQFEVLMKARTIGAEYNLSRTAMGIVYQESLAGVLPLVGDRHLPLGQRAYGLMQVRIVAAKDTLRRHPELGRFDTDEELIVALLTDEEFNIRVGILYFKSLRDRGLTWREALTAYNRGRVGMRRMQDPANSTYAVSIANHITHGPVWTVANLD